MKKLLLLSLVWLIAIYGIASATDVSGDAWGEWTAANSPYNVVGELTVPTDSTLIIDPGVSVIFQGHYKFNVETSATLIAAGTESDSIIFTAADTSEGWWGIRFFSVSDSSKISYCLLEYGRATGAYPNFDGGAIYCAYSDLIISNNTVRNNSAYNGGGLFFYYSSSTIRDNSISGNSTDYGGGGIFGDHSNLTIRDNVISNNSALYRGAGLFCYYSDATIRDNTIINNTAVIYGGGIFCNSADPTISGNSVNNNSADKGGGIYCERSNPTINDNIISYNSSSSGGGIYCYDSDPPIRNNVISSNWVNHYGGGIYCYYSNPTIDDNTIVKNSASVGGGIYCNYSRPTIMNNTINNNSAAGGGGIYCEDRSNLTLRDNIISNNSVSVFGGGISCCISSCATLENNTIVGNSAYGGGGIFCSGSDPTIKNEIICNNSAYYGGGVSCFCSSPTIENDVISHNSADTAGGAIYSYYDSGPRVINTIMWDDSAGNGEEGSFEDYSSINITYSDIEGGWEGEGNIDEDPLFRNPDEGDYHFMADYCGYPYNSPCIDAGDPSISDNFLDCDWGLGEQRSDMGAYGGEAHISGIQDPDNGTILPLAMILSQNYPNPFNAMTTITYMLERPSNVELDIYNIMGQKVATLVNGNVEAGSHTVIWDAGNYSSGIYFYKLTAGNKVFTKRMALLK